MLFRSKNIDFNAEKAEYKVACSRFSVSVDVLKSGRATSGVPLAADPACSPFAFSILLTNREPGTGYVSIKPTDKRGRIDLWEITNQHEPFKFHYQN